MKKVLLLVVLVGAVFVFYNRQRLFIRDPLGSVARDGVVEEGAQVYINYANDVLLENDHAPMYMTVVQRGHLIGTPKQMSCLHWVVCLADADAVTMAAVDPRAQIVSMSGKTVEFRSGSGRETVVKLR